MAILPAWRYRSIHPACAQRTWSDFPIASSPGRFIRSIRRCIGPSMSRSADVMGILASKAGLVTGSTSGIGLGIARALAAQGCSVLLNGFGDANAIQALCQQLQDEYGVRVRHAGADL